jgi:hypothetical protein
MAYFRECKAEAALRSRGSIALFALLGIAIVGWFGWQSVSSHQRPERPPVFISKQPVNFAERSFDPAAPPPDMPALGPGETAVCDSNFVSSATLAGETHQTDSTHATVTIARVNVTLQLDVTIWVPTGATQHVIEHEEGHRQISEYYYLTADKVADRVAATYIGRQEQISGSDLNAQSGKLLRQMASDFTDEYNKELDPGPAQQLYDNITDRSRNESVAKEAVSVAIKNAEMTSTHPVANLGN